MSKKQVIQIFLMLITIPLGELHHLLHTEELRLRDWFLFSNRTQDIEWYLKDTSEKLALIIFIAVWKSRERALMFKTVLTGFLFYRIADLLMYYMDFDTATPIYAVIYFTTGLYILLGSITSYKKLKCKSK